MKRKLFFLVLIPITIFFFSCSAGDFELENVGLFEYTGDKNYRSQSHVEISAAKNQYNDVNSENLSKDWYKDSSFYHIWVKAFVDSDGDRCGDLKGIEKNLDYIQEILGCDAIWLSPIFSCSYVSIDGNMHGYDTINYYSINEFFGKPEDLESLITEVHKRGMKIIFDFVPNHTSDAHPWFLSSKEKNSDKRNWYLWSDEQLSWNNGMSSKTWHKKDSEYYYGAFNGMMPDLNFRNYEVREEMKNVVRYWLNKGFDGLRIDAVRYLIEEDGDYCDTQATHEWFQELRKEVIDAYESPKFMVCEAWIENDRNTLNEYFGTATNPEFNMVLDFDAGKPCIYSVRDGFDKTGESLSPMKEFTSVFGTFLGNHDEYCGRVGSELGLQEKLIKQATALSLLRPTVPFIYYGNELGQPEENISGDFRLRYPIKSSEVTIQKSNPLSILNLNNKILSLRKKYSVLRNGVVTKLESLDNTDKESSFLAYFIIDDSSTDKFLCVFNFSNKAVQSCSFSQNLTEKDIATSMLIGDSDQDNTIVFTDDSVTIKKLAPYAYRVYYIGNSELKNVFDDENYIENEIVYKTMYIRGNINNWEVLDSFLMNAANMEGDTVYSIDIKIPSNFDSKTIEFKFDTSSWLNGYNWGLNKLNSDKTSGTVTSIQDQSNNIIISVEKNKTYTFTFNFTKLTFSVKEKLN